MITKRIIIILNIILLLTAHITLFVFSSIINNQKIYVKTVHLFLEDEREMEKKSLLPQNTFFEKFERNTLKIFFTPIDFRRRSVYLFEGNLAYFTFDEFFKIKRQGQKENLKDKKSVIKVIDFSQSRYINNNFTVMIYDPEKNSYYFTNFVY